MASENLGARFGIDITNLRAGIQQANTLIRESRSEFKKAAAGMDDWTKSQEGLEAKLKSLNEIEEIQNEKVKSLKSNYKKLVSDGLDPASTRASKLRTEINNEEAALEKTRKEIDEQTTALKNLDTAAENAGDEVEKTGEKSKKAGDGGFTVLKGALADLVSQGIQAAVQGFKDLASAAAEAFKEFDEGADNVIKATGATGEQADKLTGSFKNVSKSVLGDMGKLGETVGEVNTRFGATGTTLEKMSTKFAQFAEITGTDSTEAVQAVSRAMEGAGLETEDYEKVLDALAKASQGSSISADTLAESLTKNGTALRGLGFDLDESVALLAQFEKGGVNTSTALVGLHNGMAKWAKEGKNAKEEFSKVMDDIKNAPDDTTAAQIALENFGKKAGPELAEAVRTGRTDYAKFLKDVKNSSGTVTKTYDQITDGVDKAKLSIQGMKAEVGDFAGKMVDKYSPSILKALNSVFSGSDTAAEDMAAALKLILGDALTALSENLPDMADFVLKIIAALAKTIIEKLPDIVTALAETLSQVMQSLAEILPDLVITLAEAFPDIIAALTDAMPQLVDGLVGIVTALLDEDVLTAVIQAITDSLPDLIQAAVQLTVELAKHADEIFAAIVGMIPALVVALGKGLKETVNTLSEDVSDWLLEAMETPAGQSAERVKNSIVEWFKKAWEDVKQIWSSVTDWLADNLVAPVADKFKEIWTNIKEGAAGAWEGVKEAFGNVTGWFSDTFQKAWQGVKDVFTTGGEIFDGITDSIADTFKTVVNAIIRGINSVVATPFTEINGILQTLRDFEVAGFNPFSDLSDLSIPQIPELAKGGIVKGRSFIAGEAGAEAVIPLERNTEGLKMIADMLAERIGSAAPTYNFTQNNTSPKALSQYEIYRQTKNLINMVKLGGV